jgi:hypothetical protein
MLTKIASFVLVAGGLCAGAVAASTAYLPKLDAIPRPAGESAAGALTSAAPAGRTAADEPLVAAGTVLTGEVLDELAAATDPPVLRVKVKEFAFGRWDLSWLFGLSVLAIGGGAALIRMDARRHVASMQPGAEGAGEAPKRTPRETLEVAHARLSALAAGGRSGARGSAADRRHHVIEELDAVRAECFEPFVQLRPSIVAAVGMGGFARVMDSFAASERAFNRAWSAAADGYPAESEECLHLGVERLAEAIERAPG